jgi:hypothetical protein
MIPAGPMISTEPVLPSVIASTIPLADRPSPVTHTVPPIGEVVDVDMTLVVEGASLVDDVLDDATACSSVPLPDINIPMANDSTKAKPKPLNAAATRWRKTKSRSRLIMANFPFKPPRYTVTLQWIIYSKVPIATLNDCQFVTNTPQFEYLFRLTPK